MLYRVHAKAEELMDRMVVYSASTSAEALELWAEEVERRWGAAKDVAIRADLLRHAELTIVSREPVLGATFTSLYPTKKED